MRLAERLDAHVQAKLDGLQPTTMRELDGRSLPVKLRDGVARMFTPYL